MAIQKSTPARLPGTRPAGARDETAASRQVREMFSRIAPRYDLLNHLLSLRFDVIWRKRLARRFAAILARPEARILDACCGTADLALALAEVSMNSAASEPRPLVGADFAHPMLVRARDKVAARALRGLEFVEADALSLPFADGSFDLVTTAFGFRNLANYAAGLHEFRRILAPGGSLAILEFAEPRVALFRNFFRFYFQRLLPASGLDGTIRFHRRRVRILDRRNRRPARRPRHAVAQVAAASSLQSHGHQELSPVREAAAETGGFFLYACPPGNQT
jgi:demethylmenaquinone methyltransferase / 2-methoxy-6-polyprenyl-1,4-benzoquinol methylase